MACLFTLVGQGDVVDILLIEFSQYCIPHSLEHRICSLLLLLLHTLDGRSQRVGGNRFPQHRLSHLGSQQLSVVFRRGSLGAYFSHHTDLALRKVFLPVGISLLPKVVVSLSHRLYHGKQDKDKC